MEGKPILRDALKQSKISRPFAGFTPRKQSHVLMMAPFVFRCSTLSFSLARERHLSLYSNDNDGAAVEPALHHRVKQTQMSKRAHHSVKLPSPTRLLPARLPACLILPLITLAPTFLSSLFHLPTTSSSSSSGSTSL